jgi:6-phosphogluconolactonase
MTAAQILFHTAPDALQLARSLAETVAARLRKCLQARGQALLVVSGGSTPVPFLEALRQQVLDWPRVTVTLADERCVAPEDARSNASLVRTHLLQGAAQAARWLPLYQSGETPETAAQRVEQALQSLPWPAAVTVLGMGGNGHTASLFPHAPELAAACRVDAPRCLAVSAPTPPNVPVPRVTLTPRALLDADWLAVHIGGAAKHALLVQAMAPGEVAERPIRVALHQHRLPCHVYSCPDA